MDLHQDGQLPIPDNIIKVGTSVNPTKRAETLTENWSHIGIRFTVRFESPLISNPGDVESDLHIALSIINARYMDSRFKRQQMDGYTELFYDSEKAYKTISTIYTSNHKPYINTDLPDW